MRGDFKTKGMSMKRATFILLFFSTNILFVFLHIHKNGKIDKICYQNQSKQRELDILRQQKEVLTHQFQALKNPSAIKEYAAKELNMKNVALKQVHIANPDTDS